MSHVAGDIGGILDGSSKGVAARLLRGVTAVAEPVYAGAMRLRNAAFDHGFKKSVDLGRPTISVGNLTTGGTGKTPVVQWLADRLRGEGERPAVLMRGYRAGVGGSDEQRELDRGLNSGVGNAVPVHADASRVRGAATVLSHRPDVSVFILDDGFQHRTAQRQFDLVLVNAASPFGFGHVLPRGLLREPMQGLKRASAILLTHQSRASADQVAGILRTLGSCCEAPIVRADHAVTGLWQPSTGEIKSIATLAEGRPLVVAGIGNPRSFGQSLDQHAGHTLPFKWFADHHRYTASDWDRLVGIAKAIGCDRLVTTEKDWSKLSTLATSALPVEVARLRIAFADAGEQELFARVKQVVAKAS